MLIIRFEHHFQYNIFGLCIITSHEVTGKLQGEILQIGVLNNVTLTTLNKLQM